MAKIKEGPPFNAGSRHVALHASLLPADQDLLVWITEYLGCNRSEAVRTAIRMTAGILVQTQQRSHD